MLAAGSAKVRRLTRFWEKEYWTTPICILRGAQFKTHSDNSATGIIPARYLHCFYSARGPVQRRVRDLLETAHGAIFLLPGQIRMSSTNSHAGALIKKPKEILRFA